MAIDQASRRIVYLGTPRLVNLLVDKLLMITRKQKMKKPQTGGDVLLKTKGPDYFSKLEKKRWAKYRKQKKEWEKTQINKKSTVKGAKTQGK